MAHTDRQPTDEVFEDIRLAANKVWFMSDFHEDYVKEKVKYHDSVTNYADNWAGLVQQFDSLNQMLFFEYLELQESVDFLREQRVHYRYFVPREKR